MRQFDMRNRPRSQPDKSRVPKSHTPDGEFSSQEFFENAYLGIFRSTLDGNFTAVNPEFARMFGYGSPEEVITTVKNSADLFADPQRRAEIVRLKTDDPARTKFENIYRRKDGSTFPGNLTVRQVTDPDGSGSYFEGFIEDITERKQAEEDLRLRMEKILALNQVSQLVAASLDLNQTLKQIVSLVGDVFHSEYAILFLVDSNGRIIHRAENSPGILPPEWNARPRGLTRWILHSRQPVVVNEIDPDGIMLPGLGERAPRIANPFLMSKGIKSLAGLPLNVENRTVGLLFLLSKRPRVFHDQLVLLTAFASQAAFAIEKGRLYAAARGELAERKRTEEVLQESEARFREIFENVINGMVVYEAVNGGKDFRVNNFNQAAEKIESISRDSVIGRTVCEVFPGVREFGLLEVLQRVWKTGKPEHFPVGFYKDNRISGWRENYVTRLPSGEVLTVYEDVTHRKQAEESLVQSEERYRALFETSLEGIGLSKGNQVIDANRALLDIFGYEDKQEFINLPLLDHVAPESRLPIREYQKRLADGKYEPRFEYKILRKNGEVRDLEIQVTPVNLQDETYNLTTFRDITERKHAQEVLTQSEERYRALFATSLEGIGLSKGNQVIDANQALLDIFGYEDKQEFLGIPLLEHVAPESRPAIEDFQRRQAENNSLEKRFEYRILRKNGEPRDVEIAITPVKLSNDTFVLGTFRDITERKQAQKALAQQAEELLHRNEELSRLYRASGSLLSGTFQDLQELARTIIGVVKEEFGKGNCSLVALHKDSKELQRLAVAGPYADEVKDKRLTVDGAGLIPRALRTGETLNIGNVQSIPDYLPNWAAAQSELVVPLKVGGDVLGAIDIQSAQPDAFGPDDERLMTIFAERAALALAHSRLFEQSEGRVRQLAALRTIDMAISSSFDLNLTMGVLLDQLRSQLDADAADVLVYNPITSTLRFSSGQGFHTPLLQHINLRLGESFAGRAALQRQMLKIPDLTTELPGMRRSSLLLEEKFIGYVGIPLIAKGQIKGVLEVFQRRPLEMSTDQQAFLEILAGQAGIAIDNAELFDHLQTSIADLSIAYNDTLEGWASALELRDKETEGHTRRVTDQTIRLAQVLGVKGDDLTHIYRGSLLHDIGKIGVPDRIVGKTGPLSEEEWQTMRQHPSFAYKMLSPISYLRQAINIPYCHHEKWDGTGYPRGLKGEEIPLAARIFSVVDVWDALTSDRPYRKAWTPGQARAYIQEQAGKQFDPKVVEAFFNEILAY
jgi:PAS domain S-box-containing protein